MPSPRFSIVIPTRNRPRTLAVALQTCLAQRFEDFEVVVSDNHSPPETRAVVDACGDPRVRYVRTPAPLSMTDSMDFAVSHAAGEFVLILPDDDGLLLHALETLEIVLDRSRGRVVRWDCVLYNWPDILPQPYAEPNNLIVPLRAEKGCHRVLRCAAAPMIHAAINGHISYSELPVVFSSAFHRDILAEVRRKNGGRVFRSPTPDVYGAIAIAYVAGEYYSIKGPLGIAGTSGHSTGIARHFARGTNAIDREFRSLNSSAGYAQSAWVPDLPPIPCAVADAFLHARANLFPDDTSVTLDRRALIAMCLRETPVASQDEWKAVLAACRQSLADDPELVQWFDATHATRSFESLPRTVRRQVDRRYGGDYVSVDASLFGVVDVMGAARLCEQLLGYQRDGLGFKIEEQDGGPATSLSELQEKEAVIQELQKIGGIRLQIIEEQERILQDMRAYQAHLEQQVRNHEAFRERVKRPLRRGLPHLFRKLVGRFLTRHAERAA
jgi:hypothetical protein